MAGLVYLVGAGPGDPGLLTLKGRAALAAADVVLFDYLANPLLLEHARPDAETLFVGKKGFTPYASQDEINALIVHKALEGGGRTVVRLKGGDPFVFGRGSEEAEACLAAGVRFEVVPGVSSAIAAPAYAGIPVTHRGLSTGFAVLTGFDASGGDGLPDLSAHARVPTLVLLMGVRALPRVAAALVAAGRDPGTPAATVQWGTTPRQRAVSGTLGTIADRVREAGLEAPAVTVVGEVARLRERLAWFESRPLHGRTVVATRTREGNSRLRALLEAEGAGVLELPVIRHAPPQDGGAALRAAAADLAGVRWVAFTSQEGARAFLAALREGGRDARALGHRRLAAVGPSTARELEAHGLRADFVPARFGADALAAELPVAPGDRVLYPASGIAGDALEARLVARGADVARVEAYRTLPAEVPAPLLERARSADAAAFGSASAVEGFARLAGTGLPAACIGPASARAARAAGFRDVTVAGEATLEGLVSAVRARLGGN